MQNIKIINADVLDGLKSLPNEHVQCVVTSPPYWALRDYGNPGQIGLEKTPQEYLDKMTEVFREVRRVLRKDGTAWVNMGDGYGQQRGSGFNANIRIPEKSKNLRCDRIPALKPKDLIGMPWRLALALQADGWYLRSDIIWHKPNPMPESVTDRPTKSHEYIFLLTKSAKYYYDGDAVREAHDRPEDQGKAFGAGLVGSDKGMSDAWQQVKTRIYNPLGRNKRTVWTIPTAPYPGAHYATFPPALPEICIKAGSAPGDTILDPFNGHGTTGLVSARLGRHYIGIEINEKDCVASKKRIEADNPLFNKCAISRISKNAHSQK